MRVFLKGLVATLMVASTLVAQSSSDSADAITKQLPEELAANLVDPLTIHKAPSFNNGELLHFKLGWGPFSVAKASLQSEPSQYLDWPAIRITLETRTNSFADAIYKVRNKSTSYVADDVSRSYEYRAIQDEGGRLRNGQAVFDPDQLKARYINHINGDLLDPVEILPGTFDPLGIVFFIRSISFDVGDSIVVPTSNGKEFFYTIVRVTGKVERRFKYGKREAYVLEPDIKDIGGVFKRSPDGNIKFFFSADEEKLPLRMESEVAVGSFWAELVEVEKPEPDKSVAITKVD